MKLEAPIRPTRHSDGGVAPKTRFGLTGWKLWLSCALLGGAFAVMMHFLIRW